MIIIDYHHWTANGDWAFDPVQFSLSHQLSASHFSHIFQLSQVPQLNYSRFLSVLLHVFSAPVCLTFLTFLTLLCFLLTYLHALHIRRHGLLPRR